MDSFRIIMFLLTKLIAFDLAFGHSNIHSAATHGSMLQPIFRKWEWRTIHGGRQQRTDADVEKDADVDNTKPRGVYWIPTTCDSLNERGYTCLACGESLHCMGGGFGLKAICGGFRPFCNNGICSNTRSQKCERGHESQAAAAEVIAASGNATDTLEATETQAVGSTQQDALPEPLPQDEVPEEETVGE